MQLSCTVCAHASSTGGWRCPCGGPLDLPLLPADALRSLGPPAEGGLGGLWRYIESVPVAGSTAAALTMGEGGTALIDAGQDLPGTSVKLEFISATSSFKDRGAVVLVAAALEHGATRLVLDSSGNAGSAIAAYAARAGMECQVFVPEHTSARKQSQIRAYGAVVREVPGDRTAASERAIEVVERTGATYASHVYDPFFIQGTKTFAFEAWEQLHGAPGALLVPVGNGTLLLGAARGFQELAAAGAIDRPPALIGLQSEHCAPLARAWAEGAQAPVEVRASPTAAEGVAIPRPPRGAQILAAVRDSGGCLLTVPEALIKPAQRHLAGRGMFVEPTAALTWAGALLLGGHPSVVSVDQERWEAARAMAAGSLLVPLCGAGLKH